MKGFQNLHSMLTIFLSVSCLWIFSNGFLLRLGGAPRLAMANIVLDATSTSIGRVSLIQFNSMSSVRMFGTLRTATTNRAHVCLQRVNYNCYITSVFRDFTLIETSCHLAWLTARQLAHISIR